jgi:hypothetical protein
MRYYKIILVLILFSYVNGTRAQVFSVGDSSCNYFKPNTSLWYSPSGWGSWSVANSYSIDLDGDFTNDILIEKLQYGSQGGSSTWRCDIFKCGSPTGAEFIYKGPPSSCSGTLAAFHSNLAASSSLNPSLNWSPSYSNSWIYETYSATLSGINTCGVYVPITYPDMYLGFRKVLSGDTIYGWILVKTSNSTIHSYGYKHTSGNSTVVPVFTNSLAPIICEGSVVSLSANPPGGTFYGAGVSGNNLNTGICGSGNTNVYYNSGCATAVLNVSVTPAPSVMFSNSLTSLCNGDSLILTASPSGGVFSGSGVTGNVFNSSVTGAGTKVVSYSYTDGNGCSNTKTMSINVLTAPSLTVSSTAGMSCPGTPLTLTATGASSFTWSTGGTTQSIIVSPTANVVYTVTGSFSSSLCPGSSLVTFAQYISTPTVSLGTPIATICAETPANITAYGATSYSWSTGALSNVISVTPSVTTTYSVMGFHYGGCSDTAWITLNVTPNATITAVPNKTLICIGDTVIISLSGGNANKYYLYSFSAGYLPVTGTSVAISPTTTTNYSLESSCAANVPFTISVAACVGIKSLNNSEDSFMIFPNPNNGEFEIKGIREETIFISNELGQVIDSKLLAAENNYSVKVNDLQNGVYFIGSNFARQKIVVIK